MCRQLGIIQYHSDVKALSLKERQEAVSATMTERAGEPTTRPVEDGVVPATTVRLVQSLRLPAGRCAVVQVEIEGTPQGALQVLESAPSLQDELGLKLTDAVVQVSEMGRAQVLVTNNSGFTQRVVSGTLLGEAVEAMVVDSQEALTAALNSSQPSSEDSSPDGERCEVLKIDVSEDERKRRLLEMVEISGLLDPEQAECLQKFLGDHHQAFSIDPGERGETDMVQMEVDTGDAHPRRQPVRCMPFAVRQEVARQLKDMQQSGVIQPSSSPWASPVVMVKKKDGSHQFCVDYRPLNAVTKPDLFPLPRIDDLLDQLGQSHYFSTLDLALGYWQIRMHLDSVEKTAFITPQGLFEFRVMPFGFMNAPSVFQRLMSRVLMGLNPDEGPDFVAVYIDDVLVFLRTLSDHIQHLKLVIGRLQEVGLKLKLRKCHFIREEVEYLGHVITPGGQKPTPKLTVAVVEFPTPCNVREVRQFLGLSLYYRRFIPLFARIAKPLNELTRKDAPFIWTAKCQAAFTTLREKLAQAPVLAYPCFEKPFILETDASGDGIGAVLSQQQDDGQIHPIAYASRALSPAESRYAITELETLAVVWAMSHFHSFLYGHSVTVYTDHSAVKAILDTPNPSGKHARWWTKVYGRRVREVTIQYRPGKANANADALSRSPQELAPDVGLAEGEVQVTAVDSGGQSVSEMNIDSLLRSDVVPTSLTSLEEEQRRDPEMMEVIKFLEEGVLPEDQNRARKLALQEPLFTIIDRVLYYLDSKQGHQKQVVIPRHLRQRVMKETHRGPMSGHFSGPRLFNTLRRHWWWEGMFGDTRKFVRGCPECAVACGGGRVLRPELRPIPVTQPFQIVGVDVMDLPTTALGNKHVLVFQDLFTKWPMVYPVPDQKAERIVRILVDEIIPFCGVPEALLSDWGKNLLSHLMHDVCELLGVKKLNTTAYHPQCDGLVERYNRTLKTALRKHAARFGTQWDRLLSGVVWAYRNTPHESTHEKPLYLLFGFDCRTPTEAALLPPTEIEPTDLVDYREELTVSLSSARELAAQVIRQAQKYKRNYDKKAACRDYRIGEWVLVKFPADETGKMRKLSRPWHGPYRVTEQKKPDVTVVKVYRPQDGPIQVHKARVTPCPSVFQAGYYWYGNRRSSPGRPPRWVDRLLQDVDHVTDPGTGTPVEPEVSSRTQDQTLLDGSSTEEDEASTPEVKTPAVEAVPPPPVNRTVGPNPEETRPKRRSGLRERVSPPDRWISSSGRAWSGGGGDVTD